MTDLHGRDLFGEGTMNPRLLPVLPGRARDEAPVEFPDLFVLLGLREGALCPGECGIY